MKNRLLFFIFLFFLFSCAQKNRIELKTDEASGVNLLQFLISNKPFLLLKYENKDDSALLKEFIDLTISSFRKYIDFEEAWIKQGLGTIQLEYKGDLYSLYFEIGTFVLSQFQNDLFKYGIIEIEWNEVLKKLLKKQGQRYPQLKEIREKFFMIPDIDGLLKKYKLEEKELREVYAYTVRFLLKEIYFVSLQEIFSRPKRYYRLEEINTYFYRVVIMPETIEFVRYVLGKFGRGKMVELSYRDFSKEDWKKITGEEIHETELDFTKQIEGKNFSGVYNNEQFVNEMDGYLKLYNSTTKKVLFTR